MFGLVILFILFFATMTTFNGKEGVGDFGSIQRMQKGQIKGGITGDDLYLVQKEKEEICMSTNLPLLNMRRMTIF